MTRVERIKGTRGEIHSKLCEAREEYGNNFTAFFPGTTGAKQELNCGQNENENE